jgi:hypothetical protein
MSGAVCFFQTVSFSVFCAETCLDLGGAMGPCPGVTLRLQKRNAGDSHPELL